MISWHLNNIHASFVSPFHSVNKMSQTEIKICGLSTIESVSAVISGGADYMGLIFFEKSPRNVSVLQAKKLSNFAGSALKKVAVTVNATDEFLDQIVEAMKPDFIQLHGAETIDRCLEVRKRYGIKVVKAFAITADADLQKSNVYADAVDKFLFDAKAPKDSQLPGGNGVSFDWKLLSKFVSAKPYMLSGGIDELNVINALKISGAKAIDLSSGVEASPGVKNIEKIKNLIKVIREYDTEHIKDTKKF